MKEQKKKQTGGQRRLLLWLIVTTAILGLLITGIVLLCGRIPYAANNLMDLSVLLLLLPFVLLGFVAILLCVSFAEKVKQANCEINVHLEAANRNVESLAPLVDKILNGLAEPFLRSRSGFAGVKRVVDVILRRD